MRLTQSRELPPSPIKRRHCGNHNSVAVLLDRGEAPANLTVQWHELGLPPGQAMAVRDVVRKRDLPHATDMLTATVGKHDVAFVRLTMSGPALAL